MARKARFTQPGVTVLVSQATRPRTDLMREDADYAVMQLGIAEGVARADCDLHAWCLMADRILLLLTPQREGGTAMMMQSMGRRYAAHFSAKYGGRTALWGERYRCIPVEAELYLIGCMCFIENTLGSLPTCSPASLYRWSSDHTRIKSDNVLCLTPHPAFLDLGDTAPLRAAGFGARKKAFADSSERGRIAQALAEQTALGSPGFVRALENVSGHRLTRGKPGRPRKIA